MSDPLLTHAEAVQQVALFARIAPGWSCPLLGGLKCQPCCVCYAPPHPRQVTRSDDPDMPAWAVTPGRCANPMLGKKPIHE